MKHYIIGDIHGRASALRDVLKQSKFDYDNDLLIILGDVADGGDNTKDVVEEMLKIRHRVFIMGNHDMMFIRHMMSGHVEPLWVNQGGAKTLNSYGGNVTPSEHVTGLPIVKGLDNVSIPDAHVQFFRDAILHFEYNNNLFVHGGFDTNKPLHEQDDNTFLWDRSIIRKAEQGDIPGYDKIFVGHTTTQMIERDWVNYKCRDCGFEKSKQFENNTDLNDNADCDNCGSDNVHQSFGCVSPVLIGNLVCLDTGAGWDGKLTLMDVNDQQKYWQSELLEPAIKYRSDYDETYKGY